MILVGVHYGVHRLSGNALFIPIDRVYAESLRHGKDWASAELRPIPSLDHTDEGLQLGADNETVTATFVKDDFSPTLFYQASLFPASDSNDFDTWDPVEGSECYVSRDDRNTWLSYPVRRCAGVSEAISGFITVPLDVTEVDRSGDYIVRLRACMEDESGSVMCGRKGSAGTATIKLLAPPTGLGARAFGLTQTRVSWEAVTDAVGYQVGHKVTSAAQWDTTDALGTTAIVPGTCVLQEFRVRAQGNQSDYDGRWSRWSEVVSCTVVARSSWQGKQVEDVSDGEGLLLSWPTRPDAHHYMLEIRSTDYVETIPEGQVDPIIRTAVRLK